MNRHLRALVIVLGIAVLAGVATFWALSGRKAATEEQGTTLTSPVQLKAVLADFEAKTLDGQSLRLSQFRGKIVVVNFWASWCGPCIEEMPSLIKLVRAFPKDVELIAISGDSSREDIESFLKSFPELKTLPNIHLVWDETKSLSQTYQIFKLPESILLDGQQKVVKKISGIINWSAPDAFEYMKQLVATGPQTAGEAPTAQ
jgi:thiol-disulfide isomerase/thioredoxin